MTQPRRLFDELMKGVGAMRDQREGKVLLRTQEAEDFPPLVVGPDLNGFRDLPFEVMP